MNNAVFGKTMENIRKHTNIKLVSNWEGRYGAEARLANPNLKSYTIFDENLIAIELMKHETYFNKPIYIGMSILDIAKTTIYDFHYEYMLEVYDNCTIAYTDTDSLIYEIRNQNPYEIIKRDCYTRFDTSDYTEHNIYGIPRVNKRKLGFMSDETAGRIVTDFVGLRAKLYTMRLLQDSNERKRKRDQLEEDGCEDDEIAAALENEGLTKRAKGVKKAIVQNKITFEDYIDCLNNYISMNVRQNLIKSDKHKVFTITQKKIALSPHDDKRYIIKGSYSTLPWGHYSIMEARHNSTSKTISVS